MAKKSGDAVVICCDKPLLTPFCPLCGKKNEGVIGEVLADISERKRVQEHNLKREKDQGGSEVRIARIEKAIDKFDRWLSAINQLIAVTAWKDNGETSLTPKRSKRLSIG